MNFAPIKDRVIVLPAKAQARSAGGIILSAKETTEPEQGIVVAVGPDVSEGVYPGRRVVYEQGKHQQARIDGRDVLVLRDADLLAVVEA